MSDDIYKLYNLNIIDLNKLIYDKIYIDISNFLYNNNLINLYNKSRDYKKITNHFFIKHLLEVMKENYNNIFLYKKDSNFDDYIFKIVKLLKLNLFELKEIPLILDLNLIYELKSLAENKTNIDLKKVKLFCEKNDLTQLSSIIRNNPKTKLLLHK
jgi:hypothetical protein